MAIVLTIALISFLIYYYYPDQLLSIGQTLLIIFITLLPFILLIILSGFEMKDTLWLISKSFLCIFLPLILIIIGIIVGVENFNVNILDLSAVWYYVISIAWFGMGFIFFGAIEQN